MGHLLNVNTVSGLEDPSCLLCRRSRICGSQRKNTKKVALELCTENASKHNTFCRQCGVSFFELVGDGPAVKKSMLLHFVQLPPPSFFSHNPPIPPFNFGHLNQEVTTKTKDVKNPQQSLVAWLFPFSIHLFILQSFKKTYRGCRHQLRHMFFPRLPNKPPPSRICLLNY